MTELIRRIEAYRDAHWDEVLGDIDALVRIESVEDLDAAAPGAPFGPGPREALDRALGIAGRMGLSTHDCDGHIGFAELPGTTGDQLGIIGHVDVVPAGPGWTVEPFAVTRREGYLLGRGVIDDKGPLMVALHALKLWKDEGGALPFSVRVLFGANEETNMKDVACYRERFDDPTFLFTPDNQFPLGYGESGICSGTLESAPIEGGDIVELQGGQAVNAVPGEAWAVVRAADELSEHPDITLQPQDGGLVRVEAHGVSAHAAEPALGHNAIGILVDYLLEAGIGSDQERRFMRLQKLLHDAADGSGFGIQCEDEHFGALTAVGGMASLRDGCFRQSIDFRYPTTTSADRIESAVKETAAGYGAAFTMQHDKTPFLMDPDSAAVGALLDAYRTVTGEEATGRTAKGGTYARCFTRGVSFGVEKPWVEDPAWVGGMHGPDEGVSEALLKEAFTIYALAIGNLAETGLR